MFKEYPELVCLVIISIFAFTILLLLCIHEFKREEPTEQDYYNKFCTKYYDVSCDKIKIK